MNGMKIYVMVIFGNEASFKIRMPTLFKLTDLPTLLFKALVTLGERMNSMWRCNRAEYNTV